MYRVSTKIGTEISQAKSQPAAPALDERRPFNAPEVEQARGQFVAALRLHVVVLFDSSMRRSLVETHLNSFFCSVWN